MRWMLIACCKSLFPLWVVSQLSIKSVPLESDCLEERIEMRKRRKGIGRDASPEISFVMMLVCWMMWRQCCLSTTASERGTISNSRNPQAGLLPGGRLMVNFHDDPGLGPLTTVNANTWIVLTPFLSMTNMRRNFPITQSCSAPHWWKWNIRDWLCWVQSWLDSQWVEWADARKKKSVPLCAGLNGIDLRSWPDDDVCPERTSFQRFSLNSGGTSQTSDRAKTAYVTTCSFEFTYTITRPDYSRWRFTWKESTTSTNVLAYGRIEWFLCPIIFGCAWKLTELIDWNLDLLLHCQTMSWWVEYEVYLWQTVTMSPCKGYLRVTWQRFWTESRTKCHLHLVISGIFVMRSFLWAVTKVVTRPTCVIACPFNLRLMKTPCTQGTSKWSADPLDRIWCPWCPTQSLTGFHSRDNFRSTGIDVLMMEDLDLLYMVQNFEKHCDLSWLTSWLRQNEINEHERKLDWNKTSHHPPPLEWNVRPTQFNMFDFNGNCCPTNISECRSLFCLGR